MAYMQFSILFLITHTLFNLSLSSELCNPKDKNVLLRIKNHWGNPSSLAHWAPNTDCCVDWGLDVHCDENGHVFMLSIYDSDDIYQLPPFLGRLPFLSALHLVRLRNLSGPIPRYFRKLTNLSDLYISETNLTGPIPTFLGRLTKLGYLRLVNNGQTGPIPCFMGKLTNLQVLDLSSNSITGPISDEALDKLTNLTYLNFSSNMLSGPIPDFMGQRLKNLVIVDLNSNSLSGPIPVSMGLLTNLFHLTISNNQLTGSIPKSWDQLNMGCLYLSNNKIIGDASFLFENRNRTISLIDLSNNLLKFDFSNVDLARTLSFFNVSHNMIYGSLPKRLGQMRPGTFDCTSAMMRWDLFDVSYNQLCGPIPNGRRFKRTDPVLFGHNKCLCGGPLRACK